jgi:hypothetical protein
MEIPLEKLTALVNEAFERGLRGCADLKQQDMEELFQKFQVREIEDVKVWKISELKEMPEGSIFHHLIRGRCWIVERSNGSKFMQFDKGQAIEFASESDPWDKPMKLIYSER